MKLIKQSANVLAISNHDDETSYSYECPNLLIEYAGRTCYQSYDKIQRGTDIPFVANLENKGHTSVMEHAWSIRKYSKCEFPYVDQKYLHSCDGSIDKDSIFVAGNFVAFKNWDYKNKEYYARVTQDDIYSLMQNKNWKMFSATVKLVTNRGVMAELTRHRNASFSIESTRYVKYKDYITFIIPEETKLPVIDVIDFIGEPLTPTAMWINSCLNTEKMYIKLLELGWSPQQARGVLTNDVKCDIVVSMTWSNWLYVLKTRLGKGVHPQMREAAQLIKDKLCIYEKEIFKNV